MEDKIDGAKVKVKGETKDLYGKATGDKGKSAEGKFDKAKGDANKNR